MSFFAPIYNNLVIYMNMSSMIRYVMFFQEKGNKDADERIFGRVKGNVDVFIYRVTKFSLLTVQPTPALKNSVKIPHCNREICRFSKKYSNAVEYIKYFIQT